MTVKLTLLALIIGLGFLITSLTSYTSLQNPIRGDVQGHQARYPPPPRLNSSSSKT